MQIEEQRVSWGVNARRGDVGFVSHRRDFVAAGINWFSRWDSISGVPVSHTFVFTGTDQSVEAFGSGVRFNRPSSYLNDPDVALLVRRPASLMQASDLGARVASAAAAMVGRKYDFGLIVADALANTFLGHWLNRLTWGLPNRVVCRVLGCDGRVICSELVALALAAQPELAGYGVLADTDTVKPVDLFEDEALFSPVLA